MKAIVLAAGKSTRLYPLTASLPKCLLNIADKAIIDYQIEALVAAGLKEMVIVIGFQKEMIVDHLARKKYPIQITYIEDPKYEVSNPIRSLWCAREHLNDRIIFFHCDVLFSKDALLLLLDHPNESAMLYRERQWDVEAGKIIVDPSGQVLELGKHIEESRATGEYLQIAKFDSDFSQRLKTVLEDYMQTKRDGYTIDAFNEVVKDGSIRAIGVPFDGLSMEVDTVEDYETAKRKWKDAL